MNLRTHIGKILLNSPIMNAAGVNCVHAHELDQLYTAEHCGAVVTKSCTVKPRIGNPEPRYFGNDEFSINSSGLPNMGIDSYINCLIYRYINRQKAECLERKIYRQSAST